MVGEGLAPPATPVRAQSPCPSRTGGYKLFLSQKEKVTKRSWQPCRLIAPPQKPPSKKIPTSPHARIFGANGVPQRDSRFPHWGILSHQLRWQEFEFYHAPCAPRAVWAQTGLVRGDFRLRTNSIPHLRERSDPFTLSSGRGGTALAVGEVLSQTPHKIPSSNKMKIQFLK